MATGVIGCDCNHLGRLQWLDPSEEATATVKHLKFHQRFDQQRWIISMRKWEKYEKQEVIRRRKMEGKEKGEIEISVRVVGQRFQAYPISSKT